MTNSEILFSFFKSDEAKRLLPTMLKKYTDNDIAAIIWHSLLNWNEKHTELALLMHRTADEELKSQIGDRLEYDAKCLELFKIKSEGYVYVLDNNEYEPRTNTIGYYGNADIAIKAGIREGYDFTIYKHQIINDYNYIPKCRTILSPVRIKNIEQQLQEYESDDGCVSRFEFDKEGKLIDYWSNELPIDSLVRRVEALSNKRFENKFVEMPNFFEVGDAVRDVIDNKEYIVGTSQEIWRQIVSKAKEEDSGYDWFETMILVEDKNGKSHAHINPVYLTKI